jgi:hypothetical protein
MRLYRRVLFAVVFVVTGAPHAHAHADMSKVTCGAFLASGKANMAAIIMWLRGYSSDVSRPTQDARRAGLDLWYLA